MQKKSVFVYSPVIKLDVNVGTVDDFNIHCTIIYLNHSTYTVFTVQQLVIIHENYAVIFFLLCFRQLAT